MDFDVVLLIIIIVYILILMLYHLKIFDKFINKLPTSYRKIFFINDDDESKKNSILFLIIISITVCEFFITAHFAYSVFNSNHKSLGQEFLAVVKKDSLYLDLVIIIAYISTFFINKFINKLYPLRDGVDPNTSQKNITIRAETFMTIIENFDSKTLKSIAPDIGRSFAANIASQHKIKKPKHLERHLKKTDVVVANFFEDIKIKKEHDEIQIFLYGPFWRDDLQYDNNGDQLTNICIFFTEYFTVIIRNFKHVFLEDSTQSISTAIPKCIDMTSHRRNNKCYLLRPDGYCKYILKINEDAKI